MMNDAGRILECLRCEYHEECNRDVEDPEDYPDGHCKTKDILKSQYEEKK